MKISALLLATSLVFVASSVHAQSGADEIVTLEKELNAEHATLSTSDCQAACRALASIRRAADKICALDEHSSHCTNAKVKSEDATRRVREACPDCIVAQLPTPRPETPVAKASAPPAEMEKRGGCAGCATTHANTSDLGWLAGVAWAVARLTRKRRRN